MLRDPAIRQVFVREILGTLIPVQGGACNTPAGDVAPGAFGSGCAAGDYSFPANLGVGTTPPAVPLHVRASSARMRLHSSFDGASYNSTLIGLMANSGGVVDANGDFIMNLVDN